MKRTFLVSAVAPLALVAASLMLATGCDKKDSSGGSAPVASTKAQAAASGTAVASASAKPPAPLDVTGSYEAKAGEVRTPKDAPTFSNVATGAMGKGELSLVLPAEAEGAVTGKASGPLGAQTFSGMIEEGRLTGTLSPADKSSDAMTGTVLGTVSGKGDARTAEGSIRASGPDGRVVRDAAFKLEAAKK
jgi:hypothetical protein